MTSTNHKDHYQRVREYHYQLWAGTFGDFLFFQYNLIPVQSFIHGNGADIRQPLISKLRAQKYP